MSIIVNGYISLYQHKNAGVDGKCKISPKIYQHGKKLVNVEQIDVTFFSRWEGELFDMCLWSCSDGARFPGISPTVDMCLSLSNSNNQNVQIPFSQVKSYHAEYLTHQILQTWPIR